MRNKKTIYIESSCLLEGVSGIARWVEVINSALSLSSYNVVCLNKKQFGFGDNQFSDFLYYNIWLPIYFLIKGDSSAILIVPNNVSKFFYRPAKNTIYFIHDLIPLDSNCGYRGLRRYIYLLKLNQVKGALGIFTTTLFVKNQIINLIKKSIGIYPVFGFINESFCPANARWDRNIKLPSRFILAVGSGEYRKNANLILETYAKDELYMKLPPLVLFGNSWRGEGHQSIYKKATTLNIQDRIVIVGSVTDRELCYLYSRCDAFIYPSIAEGFGLPPIEALACGAKVIVNDIPVFREVLEKNATYLDDLNPQEIYQKILNTLTAQRISEDEYLKKYSIDNAQKNILNAICDIEKCIKD